MSALASPQRRPNPLNGFAPYDGEFNVLDFDYIAATAWCGLFGIVLAACVIVLTVAYGLVKLALWLLNRHAIRILSPGRSAFGDRLRLLLRVVGGGLFIVLGVFGGAATLWIGGALVRSAVISATSAGLDWVRDAVAQSAEVLSTLVAVSPQLPAAGALVAPLTAVQSALATLAHAAGSGSDTVFSYADQASLATNLIGAFFVLVGLLCTAAVALSSRRGAAAMAALLWVLMIVSWVICGITYVAALASSDACAALDALLQPAQAARLMRLVRCSDDGGAAASAAWGVVREAGDDVNAALYAFSLSGTGSGAANLQGISYKCNPAVATAGGGFEAATAPCPPLAAPIDALHNASRLFPHTVAAGAPFAAAYAAFRCPVSDPAGCAAAGLVPANTLASVAALDGNTTALAAALPALERLTRCADVTRMLRGLQLGQCPDLRGATQLVFAGFLAASIGFVGAFLLMLYGANRFLPEESVLAGTAWAAAACACECELPRRAPPAPVFADPEAQLQADKGRAVDALRVAGRELSRVAQIAAEVGAGDGEAQPVRRGAMTKRLGKQ